MIENWSLYQHVDEGLSHQGNKSTHLTGFDAVVPQTRIHCFMCSFIVHLSKHHVISNGLGFLMF